MIWLDVFKHLLPTGRAWRVTVEKRLRDFFEGLGGAPADVKQYVDEVYGDVGPDTTRELVAWEDQFGLPASMLTVSQRRARLDGAWKALGGQSPRYIQDTLQRAGFNVFVHEWWEPSLLHPAGGSVAGDVSPVARDPFQYVWDGSAPRQFVGAGHVSAYCGGDLAFCSSQNSPPGYPLVNKVLEAVTTVIGAGHVSAVCGGISLACGATVTSYRRKQYAVPADPTKYPYFLYIGGENFPDQATVPLTRRDEFEDLCLKICPLEQWLGILVTYS